MGNKRHCPSLTLGPLPTPSLSWMGLWREKGRPPSRLFACREGMVGWRPGKWKPDSATCQPVGAFRLLCAVAVPPRAATVTVEVTE